MPIIQRHFFSSSFFLFAPPTPARIIVFFSFSVPLSAEQGPGDLADAESKEVQTGSRSAAGWGGGGAGGVKASPPAPRPRMRSGAGPHLGGVPIARFCKS